MSFTKTIKVAFIHDDFIQFGGAEKLFFEIIKEYCNDSRFDLKVYSSIISPKWRSEFHNYNIKFSESFLKYLPYSYLYSKLFFFTNFFYYAFQDFDLSEYDIVITSSTRFGHFVITKPGTYHISYLNSPSRALWDEKNYFFGKSFFYFMIKKLLPKKRILDFYSQSYADLVITNSKNIQKKVKKIYLRKSIILFPFANISFNNKSFSNNTSDYFVLISRLVSWKRIDYVIKAFNENKLKLVVIGDGSEIERYKKISNSNIEFKGYVTESEKNFLLKNSLGLIFPQNEDFGITILEALNFNIPILYLNKGGAKEILNKKVGISFNNQHSNDLNLAISKLSKFKIDSKESTEILKRYSKETFINFLKKLTLRVKK